jgi:hypothetical protein
MYGLSGHNLCTLNLLGAFLPDGLGKSAVEFYSARSGLFLLWVGIVWLFVLTAGIVSTIKWLVGKK